MTLKRFKSQPMRLVVLLSAALGIMHFATSLRWWIVLFGGTTLPADQELFWNILTYAWPCLACLGVFTIALALSSFSRRCAVWYLSLALLTSASLFLYDIQNNRYQIQALTENEGCKHFYCNWWWYDG
ncbi:MAG: hypothetical protein O7D91_20430 [Planctomycetota bacterium]|nr:hypothetical protein [Planctomycetota bacterium]